MDAEVIPYTYDEDMARFHHEVTAALQQQEEQEAMDSIDKLSAAMAKAFPAIEGAVKGKVNPAFRSKYADLSAVIDAIKPHLVEHGLWFLQRTHPVDGGVGVETVILHASGQSMSCGVLRLPAAKQDAQGYGSALTYARRYSLMAAFGVPAEDDDGNAASARGNDAPQARQNGSGGTGAPAIEEGRRKAVLASLKACETRADLTSLWNELSSAEQDAFRQQFNDKRSVVPAVAAAA